MRFDERVIYRKAVLMYKSLNNLAPNYISNIFTYTSSIHQVNLRSLTDSTLYVSKPNLEIYRKTLAYSGPKIWNTIPESVRTSPSLGVFKQRFLRWKNPSTTYSESVFPTFDNVILTVQKLFVQISKIKAVMKV